MTVGEFSKKFNATKIRYYDKNGKDINYLPISILEPLKIIGSSHRADGSIDIDTDFEIMSIDKQPYVKRRKKLWRLSMIMISISLVAVALLIKKSKKPC